MRARGLAVVVLAAATAAGCGAAGAGDRPPASAAGPGAALGTGAIVDGATGAAASEVARRFALAARQWSAATLRDQWRRQVALSAGALHATLVRTPPLAADVERLRAQRASATAQVTSVVVDRVDAGAVVVLVRLAERIVTDGQVSDQVTLNRAAIVRRRGAWRVVAFTLAP